LGLPSGPFPSGFPTRTLNTPLLSVRTTWLQGLRFLSVIWIQFEGITAQAAYTDTHCMRYETKIHFSKQCAIHVLVFSYSLGVGSKSWASSYLVASWQKWKSSLRSGLLRINWLSQNILFAQSMSNN
jgi:hypothetical protein